MKKSFWSFIEICQTIIIAVAVVVLVRTFVAQPFLVSGASMEPNFYNGDYLLIDRLTYQFREPKRGEVVVFKGQDEDRLYYVKRILGLPNERVIIRGNQITIFGSDGREKELKESYLKDVVWKGDIDISLGGDSYFVLGDNRVFSFDSRNWGALEVEKIIGLVKFRLWPVQKIEVFAAPNY